MKIISSVKKDATRRQDSCGCDCCCGHDGSHQEGQQTHKGGFNPILAVRLMLAALLFSFGVLIKLPGVWNFALILISAVIAGYDVVIAAVMSIIRKKIFDENLLMTIAAVAAFIIGETYEGAAVVILFQFGELLQSMAVGRARKNVIDVLDKRPAEVTVIRGGKEFRIGADHVSVGEVVVIVPGERVAFDCVVLEGESTLDMSMLTGESLPRRVGPDDEMLSGAVNMTGLLRVQVTAKAEDSTASRILDMVQAESAGKSKTERFITRFAAIYTPIVIGLAVLIAVLPPLITQIPLAESIHRALTFLVISCPCALVISVPLSYFAGIGGAAKHGVVFKSAQALDAAAEAGTVVFDKTGTLTTGDFRVTSVKSARMDAKTLLRVAAHAEAYSSHPIARSIVAAYDDTIYIELIQHFQEHPGMGITVVVDGVEIGVGSERLLTALGAQIPQSDLTSELAVYISVGGLYGGRITLGDMIREDSAETVRALEEECLCYVGMLTGDSALAAARVAQQLGIQAYQAECLPDGKVEYIHALTEKEKAKTVIFVGDGLNDAPVLLAADMGVAMGGIGSDAAVEAADVVIMDDSPSKIVTMIRSARATRRIITGNIVFVIFVKALVLILAGLGIANMWIAVFADVGTALLAILNALRAMYKKPAPLKVPGDRLLSDMSDRFKRR